MSTQLQTIRTEILETAGLASDDVRFPDATLTRIINRALRQISSEAEWPWNQTNETITTINGTIAYTPTAGWRKTIRLSYLDRDLHEYQPHDAQRYSQDTGTPQGFYIEEDEIHLVPVPDGVYSVVHIYQAIETALSGDTDTPALPDRYIDWLVFSSLVQVASTIRDTDLYSIADRERKAWRKRVYDDRRRSTGTLIPKARDDWWV